MIIQFFRTPWEEIASWLFRGIFTLTIIVQFRENPGPIAENKPHTELHAGLVQGGSTLPKECLSLDEGSLGWKGQSSFSVRPHETNEIFHQDVYGSRDKIRLHPRSKRVPRVKILSPRYCDVPNGATDYIRTISTTLHICVNTRLKVKYMPVVRCGYRGVHLNNYGK